MLTSADHDEFMREAVRLAAGPAGEGGPFGAVVVRQGQIIGRGRNQVTVVHDPTAHAEIVAIRQACAALESYSLSGCTIYTSCEPCPMCRAAIFWARIDRIYYAAARNDAAAIGFDDAICYEELLAEPDRMRIPTQQLDPAAAKAAMAAWSRSPERTPY